MGDPNEGPAAPQHGDRISELRRAQQLTQPELAARAGVSISTVARAERGDASVGPRMVARIAGALSVDPSEIFDEQLTPRADQPVTSMRAESMHTEVVTRLRTIQTTIDRLETLTS